MLLESKISVRNDVFWFNMRMKLKHLKESRNRGLISKVALGLGCAIPKGLQTKSPLWQSNGDCPLGWRGAAE